MKKLFKSRKALSPVVAAIILIAVTVAVSIAVAAWMGALTFTFMATEEITFTGYTWDTSSPSQYILLAVKNTGSGDLSISEVRISGVTAASVKIGTTTVDSNNPYLLNPGSSATLNVTRTEGYTSGTKYEFVVISTKGNQFGPYIKTAP